MWSYNAHNAIEQTHSKQTWWGDLIGHHTMMVAMCAIVHLPAECCCECAQPVVWTGSSFVNKDAATGARRVQDSLELHVKWNDGFDTWLSLEALKKRHHCRTDIIDFLVSKVRKKSKG